MKNVSAASLRKLLSLVTWLLSPVSLLTVTGNASPSSKRRAICRSSSAKTSGTRITVVFPLFHEGFHVVLRRPPLIILTSFIACYMTIIKPSSPCNTQLYQFGILRSFARYEKPPCKSSIQSAFRVILR